MTTNLTGYEALAEDFRRRSLKYREDRIRRRLICYGMRVHKARTRNPQSPLFGLYQVTKYGVSLTHGFTLTINELSDWAG